MPEEPNDSDIFKDYEEGKHRRYSLLFAVNGGAFAVAKLYTECSSEECEILGSLEVWHLSHGMALFTIVMVLDIFMFGENMRKKTSEKGSTNRRKLSERLSDFFSRSGLFSLQGKLVLISIGLLISAGWTLVSFRTFGVLGLALVILGLLGSIAIVILLPPRQEMEMTGQPYSSGEWLVQAGSEEDFIERWTTFIEWSLNNAPGAESFVLVRSTEEPRRFLSLGAWENQEAQKAWREMPQMQELFSQCRELCEEFEFHQYTLVTSPSR